MYKLFLAIFITLFISICSLGCSTAKPFPTENKESSTDSKYGIKTEWVSLVDETMVVPSNNMSSKFFTTNGRNYTVKYSVDSTNAVDLYWVPSQTHFLNMQEGNRYDYYPSLSTQNILRYNSPEGTVPSDSGLVIVNKGQVDANVKILIEYQKKSIPGLIP